jgi:predicted amino acid racemase
VNRVIINLSALRHNLRTVDGWMSRHGASWTLVTKLLCGHEDTLRALHALGVRSVGETRLDNLKAVRSIDPDVESWYLRVPSRSSVEGVARYCDVSLNSEREIIHLLNKQSGQLGKTHRVVVMIELGDLREGILPGSLVEFYNHIFELPNIEVVGVGANLGCLAGAVPTIDQFMQLVLYRELLELKFDRKLHLVSAGTSATLPMVLDGQLPKTVNHFRIGESVFLGTDLINGGRLAELRDDAVILEAEVIEVKRKSLVPMTETAANVAPFGSEVVGDDFVPGQRGYRALVGIGQLDTDVAGLTPENPNHQIAGASSDITVVNIGESPGGIGVGNTIRFRPNYAATVRLMSNQYISKVVAPDLESFRHSLEEDADVQMDPIVGDLELNAPAGNNERDQS